MKNAAPAMISAMPMKAPVAMYARWSAGAVLFVTWMPPTMVSTRPAATATSPRTRSRFSPAALVALSFIDSISLVNSATRSGCSFMIPSSSWTGARRATSSAEVGGRQLGLDLRRLADAADLAVQHDGRDVGDAQHRPGELLDHEDRHTAAGDLGDDAVQLLDHQRREAHRQLV